MSYHTLTAPAFAELEVKKSQFLAFAYPIDGREALMFHVEQLKNRYPDARHICYGYIIGDPHNTTHAGFDDDGEPSGTAGRPILNVLQHKAIGNVAVFVVRYFGGIKLGAGGLVRAYAGATQAVVDVMVLSAFVEKREFLVSAEFSFEAQLRHVLEKMGGAVLSSEYDTQVHLTVLLPKADVAKFSEAVSLYATLRQ
ncbi:MAG: YigZ family protein [Moraxella sp.]|nr:YigZ family protein [Moraxella sp.]